MLALIFLSSMFCIISASVHQGGFVNQLEGMEEEESDFNQYTEEWLQECENNNGTQAAKDITAAVETLTDCVTSKINVFEIAEKIKEATPRGALDEVFAGYCNLIPEIKSCRAPMISALQVCLSDQGDEDVEIINTAIDGALEFMCFKGGERIAIFLAENGTECVTSNSERILSCVNETMPQIESLLQDTMTMNNSLFDPTNCWLESRLKACVVDNLQSCSDPTPANVIEGLIESMIRKTPCYRSGAPSYFSSCVLIAALLVLLSYCHTKPL